MPQLNEHNCYLQYGNTGAAECDWGPSEFEKLGLIPHNDTFAAADGADTAAFIAALETKRDNDSPNSRMYVLGDIVEQNFTGQAAPTQSFKSGLTLNVRRGTVAWDFTFTGGMQQHREFMKFSGKEKQFDLVLFDKGDENYTATALGRATGTSATPLGGFYLSKIYVGDYMSQNGSEVGMWVVSIELQKSNQFNKDFAFIHLDSDPFATGTGFVTALLSYTSSGPTNLHITAKDNYGNDLRPLYGTELGVTGAFPVRNATTKAAITIVSNTPDGTGWTLVLAATGVDADNPGTGGKVLVGGALASVWDGFNVTGLESNTITATLG